MRHNITFWDVQHPNGSVNMMFTVALAAVFVCGLIVCGFIGMDTTSMQETVTRTAPAVWKVFAWGFIPLALNVGVFALHRNAFIAQDDVKVLNAYYNLPKSVRKTYNVKHADLLSLLGQDRRDFISEANNRTLNERQHGPLGNLISDLKITNQTYKEMQ